MDLRQLRYVVAVAEEGNVTRAAERLWMAQSGLSQQVLALERELGIRLFERLSRGVVLTEAGEVFLERARATVAAADDALAAARDVKDGFTGSLRLGADWRARYDLAPALVGALRTARPQIDLTVVEAETGTLLGDVRDGRLDAALVRGPRAPAPGLESVPIVRLPMGVVMAPGHRLARVARVSAVELRHEAFAISGGRGGRAGDEVVSTALHALGIEPRLVPGGYGFAMMASVRSGDTLLTDISAALALQERLLWRPVHDAPTLQRELVWRSGTASAPLRALVELAGGAFREAAQRDAVALRARAVGRPVARLAGAVAA
jgi:DNA-binding transcriptional LysR family regulator